MAEKKDMNLAKFRNNISNDSGDLPVVSPSPWEKSYLFLFFNICAQSYILV